MGKQTLYISAQSSTGGPTAFPPEFHDNFGTMKHSQKKTLILVAVLAISCAVIAAFIISLLSYLEILRLETSFKPSSDASFTGLTGFTPRATAVPTTGGTGPEPKRFAVANSFIDTRRKWPTSGQNVFALLETKEYYAKLILKQALSIAPPSVRIRAEVTNILPFTSKSFGNVPQIFFITTVTSPAGVTLPDDFISNVNTVMEKAFDWKLIDKISPGWSAGTAFIRNAMNKSVDPCNDFHQFACGSWINRLSDSLPTYNVFSSVRLQVTRNMISIFNGIDKFNQSLPKAVRKGSLIYERCVTSTNASIYRNQPLLNLLKQLGGWPIISGPNWSESGFNVAGMVAVLDRWFNLGTLLSSYVFRDYRATDRNRLWLSQASLALGSRDYYLNQSKHANLLRQYRDSIGRAALILAKDNGDATLLNASSLDAAATAIFEFERQLALIQQPESRDYSTHYNEFTMASLRANYTTVDWDQYYQRLLGDNDEHLVYLNTTSIIVERPTFLTELEALLNRTPKRTVADYLLWRLVDHLQLFLDDRLQQALKKTRRTKSDEPQPEDVLPPTSAACVRLVTNTMPHVSGRLFVERLFPPEAKSAIEQIIVEVKGAFSTLLGQLWFLDPKSEVNAQKKLAAILPKPAYPDWILNDTTLDEYYHTLNLDQFLNESISINDLNLNNQSLNLNLTTSSDQSSSGSSFFDLYVYLQTWRSAENFAKLLQAPETREHYFSGSSATVNAFYSPIHNTITFPAGILQPPWFRYDFPRAVNFGAMGSVVGHELTHGFDDHGCQFDWDGVLNPWMEQNATTAFKNMAQCIVDQYSGYCNLGPSGQSGICINGAQTQGENIADNGGIREAYLAYENWVKVNGDEPRYPLLEQFSPKQLFFLSYASFWCGRSSEKDLTNQLLTDPHSPGRVRVLATLKNFEKFGEVFNCRKGKDAMYPSEEQKCYVWANPPGKAKSS